MFSILFYNLFSGIWRALGDSRTPLYFLILSSLLNVVLDLVFILNFSWGVAGAAYATVISQAVSAVLCFLYMRRKLPILAASRDERKPDLRIMGGSCIGASYGPAIFHTAIGPSSCKALSTPWVPV